MRHGSAADALSALAAQALRAKGQALHFQLHYQLVLLPTHYQSASRNGAVKAAQLS
jgi:hypothetical protein